MRYRQQVPLRAEPEKRKRASRFWAAVAAAGLLALLLFILKQNPGRPVEALAAVVTLMAAAAPASIAPPPPLPAQLSLRNRAGVMHYSGAVRDEATRAATVTALAAAFGADHIKGKISVSLDRRASPWLAKLPKALEYLRRPGLTVTFAGSAISLGGAGEGERGPIIAALKELYGESWSYDF